MFSNGFANDYLIPAYDSVMSKFKKFVSNRDTLLDAGQEAVLTLHVSKGDGDYRPKTAKRDLETALTLLITSYLSEDKMPMESLDLAEKIPEDDRDVLATISRREEATKRMQELNAIYGPGVHMVN